MDWGHGIVSRDPEVLNGDLVFAGTRVPVKTLVDYLATGDTLDYFLEGFPGVSRKQAVAYLEMSHKVAEETVGASAPQ
ncbi:MAG: DUF433 domain-containing protein [Rubrobacter sp.]